MTVWTGGSIFALVRCQCWLPVRIPRDRELLLTRTTFHNDDGAMSYSKNKTGKDRGVWIWGGYAKELVH